MTARGLGLSVAPIGEEWLLLPENSESEQEIARLHLEIAQLKKTEPQFKLVCVDDAGGEVKKLELNQNLYEPLKDEDVSKYVDILKAKFPVATEFNRQMPNPNIGLSAGFWRDQWHFASVSEEVIANYKDWDYPNWIEDCRKMLSLIHESLQRWEGQPYFRFEVANEGTSTGNHALVTIRAQGKFKICPPPFEEDDPDNDVRAEPSIPSPPTPPRGRWRSTPTSMNRMLDLDASGLARRLEWPSLPVHSLMPEKPRRDPNGFYYKPRRITEPSDTFSLECEQWRHATGTKPFDGYIFLPEGVTTAVGALECEIHAENLSEPTRIRIPVQIDLQNVSPKEYANNLVDPPGDKLF